MVVDRYRAGLLLLVALLVMLGVALAGPTAAQSDPVVEPPPLPQPPVGVWAADPAFGTPLLRLTDAMADGAFATHIYSQLQAFSPDDAYLLLIAADEYAVYRLDDLRRLDGLDTSTWNAPRWHAPRPGTIIHYDSNDDATVRVQLTDVAAGATETIFTFPDEYEYVLSNQSFDELSRDGRWLAGAVQRADGAMVLFALDLAARALGAVLPVPDLYTTACAPDSQWGAVEPDWVGVSPLGRTLVVQWVRDGTTRCSGLETFDLATGAFIGRVYDGHQHGDLGTLPDGETEFFMTVELASPADPNRPALAYRALPGTATVSEPVYLTTLDWADDGHISCQGPPGVCLVTYGGWADDGWTPFEREVFLQYTDGTVRRLAHHRSSSCGYWVQPRASLSRSGRYAVFASDWAGETGLTGCADGSDLGAGEAYLLDLGED